MKHFIRITLYLVGFFFLALGVNLAIKSNLGVSPVSSVPLSISNISGISLGTVTTAMFIFYVFMQMLVLRKDFKAFSLLQMGFGFVFGFFVDFTSVLLNWLSVSNYFGQLFLLVSSTFFIAVALMLIITMEIVPGAPEGFVLAVSQVTKIPFAKLKVWFDCSSVILAVMLSLAFLGNISSIREGTIISALIIGRILGILSKMCKPHLQRIAFYNQLEIPISEPVNQ
ncbi:hypothetical protein HYG86_05300 [Alkalicella caledoniensis]|uniref:Membrane protein YczE n=1 Tax=Alkalicella caledoniensis TaxID=2731377 RepID=A0A7G9W6B6_ALKCA|nr:DUF6198 family protein [Alkalicella caledoniensis]QNO14228.1 hypothetical protein HYG86_05300 [Alkalicella caledoniensis]